MRYLSYDGMMLIFDFWVTLGGKIGVATTRPLMHNGLGPPKRWANRYLKIMFSKFSEGIPLKTQKSNIAAIFG